MRDNRSIRGAERYNVSLPAEWADRLAEIEAETGVPAIELMRQAISIAYDLPDPVIAIRRRATETMAKVVAQREAVFAATDAVAGCLKGRVLDHATAPR